MKYSRSPQVFSVIAQGHPAGPGARSPWFTGTKDGAWLAEPGARLCHPRENGSLPTSFSLSKDVKSWSLK